MSARFEDGDFVRSYLLRQTLYVYFRVLQVLWSIFDMLLDIIGGVKDLNFFAQIDPVFCATVKISKNQNIRGFPVLLNFQIFKIFIYSVRMFAYLFRSDIILVVSNME